MVLKRKKKILENCEKTLSVFWQKSDYSHFVMWRDKKKKKRF
jgi:hypothetical protein